MRCLPARISAAPHGCGCGARAIACVQTAHGASNVWSVLKAPASGAEQNCEIVVRVSLFVSCGNSGLDFTSSGHVKVRCDGQWRLRHEGCHRVCAYVLAVAVHMYDTQRVELQQYRWCAVFFFVRSELACIRMSRCASCKCDRADHSYD